MTDNADMTVVDELDLSRRSVVKTAAWAAPAILIATAVPAFTGSGQDLLPSAAASFNGDLSNTSDKLNKNAFVVMTIARNDTYEGTLAVSSVTINFEDLGWNNGSEPSLVSSEWEIDNTASSLPLHPNASAPYKLVVKPKNATSLEVPVQLEWGMPKYRCTSITAVGVVTSGSASGVSDLPITLYTAA